MNIDLSELYSHVKEKLEIDTHIEYEKDYYKNTKIKDLKDVYVKGYIYLDSSNLLKAKFAYSGVMTLVDDISLEDVNYSFSSDFDDFLEENSTNFQNTLDLKEILWENIVLEIPLKFTKVSNLKEFNGDGWCLVGEDELKRSNNPFSDLLNEFEEE